MVKAFLADSVSTVLVFIKPNSNVEEQLPFIFKGDIRGSKLLTSV